MPKVLSIGVAPSITVSVKTMPWWLRYAPARVIFLDDMEGVLKWSSSVGTLTKDNTIDAFEASNALKLVTGAVAGNEADAAMYVGATERSKMALQLRWHAKNAADTTLRSFRAMFYLYDGAYVTITAALYLKNLTTPQNKWQYLDSAGNYSDVPGGSQTIDTVNLRHHFLRVVVDMSLLTPKYSLFEFDNLIIKPPELACRHYATVTTPYLGILLAEVTDVALASNAWVDALCLSDQEP